MTGEAYAPTVYNKWTLPFNGGPLYSVNGLIAYDNLGENYNDLKDYDNEWGATNDVKQQVKNREIVNRKLIYFDSPDLIYSRISDKKISSGKIKVLGRLNTDHTSHLIRSRYPEKDQTHEEYKLSGSYAENETYQDLSFSRKTRFYL